MKEILLLELGKLMFKIITNAVVLKLAGGTEPSKFRAGAHRTLP